MLFRVDMIYLAKQAERDVEKSFALRIALSDFYIVIFHKKIKTSKGTYICLVILR